MVEKITESEVDKGYTKTKITGEQLKELLGEYNEENLYGVHHLIAKYLENDTYSASIGRALMYYMYKVRVFVPTIYTYIKSNNFVYSPSSVYYNMEIKSYVYLGNQPVNKGQGIFKINNKTLSITCDQELKKLIQVSDGMMYLDNLMCEDGDTNTLTKTVQNNFIKTLPDDSTYECVYEGSVSNLYSSGRCSAKIIGIELYGIPLLVQVSTIIVNEYEDFCLVARVSHLEYGTFIDGSSDVPLDSDENPCGSVMFSIDGSVVGEHSINREGYSYCCVNGTRDDGSTTYNTGLYEVTCQYKPCDELSGSYKTMYGAGVLIVGYEKDKPEISKSSTSILRGVIGTPHQIVFEVTNNVELNGYVEVYLDELLVTTTNTLTNSLIFEVTIPLIDYRVNKSQWINCYRPGPHNMTLIYYCVDGREFHYVIGEYFIKYFTQVWLEEHVSGKTDDSYMIQDNNLIFDVKTLPIIDEKELNVETGMVYYTIDEIK